MSNNNINGTDKLIKFLTFATISASATVITYVMVTSAPVMQ